MMLGGDFRVYCIFPYMEGEVMLKGKKWKKNGGKSGKNTDGSQYCYVVLRVQGIYPKMEILVFLMKK